MLLNRTPSEAALAQLHLDFSSLRVKPEPSGRIPDEDLDSLPMLSASVMEEREQEFAQMANRALLHLATPPALSSGTCYSPFQCSPLPDADPLLEINPFFARKLYHDKDEKWARSSTHTPASSENDSGYFSLVSDCGRPGPLPPAQPPCAAEQDDCADDLPSLAERRGRPMTIELPPKPDMHEELRRWHEVKKQGPPQGPAAAVAGFFTPGLSTGLLKSNFAGVSLARPRVQAELSSPSFEAPPQFRRTRRDHGFAF